MNLILKSNQIKKMMLMDKNMVEKLRIFLYRIRKKYYIKRTGLLPYTKSIKSNEMHDAVFFYDLNNISSYSDAYRNKIIQEADNLTKNIYRTISGDTINILNQINWNKDYIHNYEWHQQHYAKYKLKNSKIKQDVKHTWEFSRFYFLVILAQAYCITKNDKYSLKLIEDIKSWEAQNPFNYSINWTVSMEVAIRAVNLIQSISLIKDSEILDSETISFLNNLIYKHGVYIINNLEKGFNTNNHYLSNLIGLIWIGVYFKEAKDLKLRLLSNKYLRFSLNQLLHELSYQVYEDGFCYEDSIAYHGLNTEMLLLTIKIMDNNSIQYPEKLKTYVSKMVDSLRKIMIKEKIPLFGDLDNGRLLICDISSFNDKTNFDYLIKLALDMRIIEEKINLVSPVSFNDSGFYRLFNSQYDIILRCGKIGLNGIGAHAHNDQLSFVLNINGEQILIDSGTGYYSGDYDLRKKLRSTSSHNTLSIEGHEQNKIDFDLFKMIEKTHSEVQKISNNYFKGIHHGYSELGLIHKREIILEESGICVIDSIEESRNTELCKSCRINFIVNEDISIKEIASNKVLLLKDSLKIELVCENGQINVVDHLISKSYSSVMPTKKLVLSMNDNYIKTFINLLNSKGEYQQ